jgi:hypothetical protein
LSFCRGSEVQADRSTASDTKPTDSRTIVGSYPGDHRIPAKDGVKDSLNQASTGHGAFDTMGAQRMNQFPNGKNDKA